MCGICGFYSKKRITTEQLKIMNDSMLHRGPDDSGEVIFEGKNGYYIGLAHRRLSILDLSKAGHQPVTSADGSITVVFNGEIYNYRELKKELYNYPFSSACDTEVILAGYLKWGTDCVKHFNGMFAIAIYDRSHDKIVFFRDRIGKKPLYYWLNENGIVFASELKPVMLYPGFRKSVRRDVLPRYLLQHYICAPDTIFENVYKLENGSVLEYRQGRIRKYKYWNVADVYHSMRNVPVSDYGEAKEGLKEKLKKAVKRRLLSDVPFGALLSGGYDSSLIAALAQEILGSEPLMTFSVGFYEDGFNEAGFAKAVAGYLGTRHKEFYCDENDMVKLVGELPRYYDEPFADSSEIPTMLVSKLAKEEVTVVLSGDGGDEFFCGYNIYDMVRRAQQADKIGRAAHFLGRLGNLEKYYPAGVKAVSQNTNEKCKAQVLPQNYIKSAEEMGMPGLPFLPVRYETEDAYNVNDWQIRRMLLDMDTYLPEDILAKADRASMKYSLECRCPILDPDVMEYSFRIDHNFKYRKGKKKYILKDITHDYIPESLMDRPKTGFAIPLDKWMRGMLKDQLAAYSDTGFLNRQGLFNAKETNRIIRQYLEKGDAGRGTGKNYSGICWNFFIFQQWYEYYVH